MPRPGRARIRRRLEHGAGRRATDEERQQALIGAERRATATVRSRKIGAGPVELVDHRCPAAGAASVTPSCDAGDEGVTEGREDRESGPHGYARAEGLPAFPPSE
jgi:hypothetical protein